MNVTQEWLKKFEVEHGTEALAIVMQDSYMHERGFIMIKNENVQKATQNNTQKVNVINNFAQSMVTWAGSGFKKVQQHVYEKRLAICRKCQFWQENGNMGMGKCLKCGCGKGKHWLPHEQCPIGLWGKEQ
jgi:hypothetical protein